LIAKCETSNNSKQNRLNKAAPGKKKVSDKKVKKDEDYDQDSEFSSSEESEENDDSAYSESALESSSLDYSIESNLSEESSVEASEPELSVNSVDTDVEKKVGLAGAHNFVRSRGKSGGPSVFRPRVIPD